jgi:hypothetical protein
MAVGLLLALTLVSCARNSSTGGPTPANVYSGSLRVADVAPLLNDSGNWSPGAPTFGVRPLDISNTATEQRFVMILRFVHVGTPETLNINYRVWNSTSVASIVMSNTQSSVGSTQTGPAAGDQILYFTQMLSFGAAPYVSIAMVRIGQTVVTIEWSRIAGFASTNQSGRLASKVASRLQQSLAGKLHASPPQSIDASLLPAPGPDLALLGTSRLPIAVLASMLDSPSPADLTGLFSSLGVADFVYGDYTLDADTHMEFQTSAFSFSTPADATNWINAAVGASSLDTSGNYINFDQTTGQYVAFFAAGSHGVVMICKSSAQYESASRSCEDPLTRVVAAWKTELAAAG